MIKIGFTGTRDGMTEPQKAAVFALLMQIDAGQFHHGDCIGADDQAHDIAQECGFSTDKIHIHPADIPELRAYNQSDHIYQAKAALQRNRDIVDATDYMIAAPKTYGEITRSGTWMTVRYARKQHKAIHIIAPDGKIRYCPALDLT